MKSKPMSLSRFRELVAAYGASVARFPESERAAAEALLEVSDHARMLAASERGLDAWLDAASAPALPDDLARRLARVPLDARAPRRLPVRRRALLAPVVGWAMAAAVGVWIGTQSPEADAADADALADATTAAEVDGGGLYDPFDGLLDELEELP